MKGTICFCMVAALLALPAGAQGAPASGNLAATQAPAAPAVPALDPVQPLLATIQATARATTADVSLMNIRRWKVGGDVKDDAQTKAEAIQRNLTVAMPAIVEQIRSSPNDFAANFKLYRTLGVLYDVLASLTESAGAFGSKSEFEPLAADLNHIDQERRAMGDRLESMAGAKDAEIARLQTLARGARVAAPAQPKKVIVDEDEKPPAKKKAPPKKPATTTTNPPQQNNPQ